MGIIIRAKGPIAYRAVYPPFQISDLGSDIINYWNVDTGKTTYNTATKISEWSSLYGQQSKLVQANSSYQLIQYYINRRTDRLALQPSWSSAANWMSATLTSPVAPPFTRYFVFVGPETGEQYIFSGGNSLLLSMSTTNINIGLANQGNYGVSSSYKGETAFPLDRLGWHVLAWHYDGYMCHKIYLDDPLEPWASIQTGSTNSSFSKVSFFNENGGTAWWNQIGDLLDCKSAHNVTTRTNVMGVLRDRFFPLASTPTASWTPLALSSNLIAQYEVSPTGVVMSSFALQDGDMSYVDASKWSHYNCSVAKVTGGPPVENVTNKVLRATNTAGYGCVYDSMYNVTSGCWYRISGWVKRDINNSASPWIDFANNTAVWTGVAAPGNWEKFNFVVKAPNNSGPTFRNSYYNNETCDWANLKVECLSVRQLTDLSGRGNHLLSASDLTSPYYSRSQTGRGKPGIRFDGVDDILKAAFTVSSTGTAHIFMAFKHFGTGANTNKTVFDGATVNGMRLYYDGGNSRLATYAGGWAGSYGPVIAYTTNNWTLIDVVFKAGSNQMKIGSKGGTQVTGTAPPIFDGLSLGACFGSQDPSGMIFYGGFIADRELTTEERANAVAYYKDRVADYYY